MGSPGAPPASTVILPAEDPWLPLRMFPTFLVAFACLLFAVGATRSRGSGSPMRWWWRCSFRCGRETGGRRWRPVWAVWSGRVDGGLPALAVDSLGAVGDGLEIWSVRAVSRSTRNAFDPARPAHWLSFLAVAGVAAPVSAASRRLVPVGGARRTVRPERRVLVRGRCHRPGGGDSHARDDEAGCFKGGDASAGRPPGPNSVAGLGLSADSPSAARFRSAEEAR